MIRPSALVLLLATALGAHASSRSLQQATDTLTCDGQKRYLSIPEAPYPQSPPWDSPYNNPDGIYCSRPQAGQAGFGSRCGSQPSVQCLPYSSNIGPTNQAPQYAPDNLQIPPTNPLLFTLDPGSQKRFLFANWTVFDVGTGGAKLVANYADGGSELITHSPFPNGPQLSGFGTASCGACSDCNVGVGIKSMAATSLRNSGFISFALSQLYDDAQCGASCVDLDASYWVGMEYICVEPTCGNTKPTQGGAPQPWSCPSTAEFNPAAASSNVLSDASCCLVKTCSNPNPASQPGIPFPCPDFNVVPIPPASTGQNCSLKMPMPNPVLGVSVVACCDCVSYDASIVDLKVTKEVTASKKKKKKTKKKKNNKKNNVQVSAATAGNEEEEVDAAAAAAPASFGSTASQPVGSTFTFRLTVINNALYSADNVVLVDTMPAGLSIVSVMENPSSGACSVSGGSTLRCSWSRFDIQTPKTITVTATGVTAGTWQNCAQVSTTSNDRDSSNDRDCATAVVLGSCCTTSTGGSTVCQDTLSADCRRINSPTMRQVFNPDVSCESPNSQCAATKGACCLKSSSGVDVCIDGLTQDSCTVQNNGIFFQGGRCSTGLCGTNTPDLVLTMTGPTTPQEFGATFPFVINVRLTSPSNLPTTVNLVQMVNTMPPGLEIVSVAEVIDKGGIVNISPDKSRVAVTWPSMSVPSDATRNVVVTVKSTRSGTFTSPSRVTTTSTETNMANNADSATVTIKDPRNTADLSLLMTGPTQPVAPGSIVALNVLVRLTSPTSPATVKDVQVVQDMPPGLTIVSVTENPPSNPPAQIEFSQSSLSASWPSMSLPSDSTRSLTVNVRANNQGTYTTNARVITSSPETNLNNNADSATIVVQGSDQCVLEWRPCDPRADVCCDGLSCEYTWAGCKVGTYVCKSRGADLCVGAGSPCGGSSGLTCCKGLMCQWDYGNNGGTCVSSGGCTPPGGGCGSDSIVCRGCRCFGGVSKWVTWGMCNKRCSSYSCYVDRRYSCDAYYASAASL